jgi:hypothetical protein
MYLLTNECTNPAGVYRITIKRIKDDTGIPRNDIKNIIERFQNDGKAFYIDEFIILPKWPKHQKFGVRGKLYLGAMAVLKSLPDNIKEFISDRKHYDFDITNIGYVNNQIPYQNDKEKEDRVSEFDENSPHDFDSDLDFKEYVNLHNDASACDFENSPQKLFIHLWQHNSDVFNCMARIDSPKEWDNFWKKSDVTCEQVKTAIENFVSDVHSGAIEPRYIPSTPDRFVLNGLIQKCQKHFRQDKTAQPGTALSSRPKKIL